MGDLIEAINPSDKRFDGELISERYWGKFNRLVELQIDDIVDILSPIKGKCLGLLDGNHELTLTSTVHRHPTKEICMGLGVDYLAWEALIRLKFRYAGYKKPTRVMTTDIYATHGRTSSRSIGGKLNPIVTKLSEIEADVYLMGHGHSRAITSAMRGRLNTRNEVVFEEKRFILTGSFFQKSVPGHITYSEKGGYGPLPIGVIEVKINPLADNRPAITAVL